MQLSNYLKIAGLAIILILAGLYFWGKEQAIEKRNLEPMIIKGSSMEPTLLDGQEVLIDKDVYKESPIQRGDIIAFKFKTVETAYVKRVIATSGDKLEFSEGEIFINGQKLKEPYLKDPNYKITDDQLRIIQAPLKKYGAVPQKSLLVLSDNRSSTNDSRRFGFVPEGYVVGRIVLE